MGGLENRKYVLQAEYDFAKDGGAVGDIVLRGASLPAGAVLVSGVIVITTTLASAGAATAALKVEGSGDVLAAGVVTALTAGLHDVVPAGTAATMIKTTDNRELVLSVGVADLTAGKMTVCLDYYITD